LRLRVHGPPGLPLVLYLPGIHGDWTLVGGLRDALAGRVRFAEFTYPRTTDWSLGDYACAIESLLLQAGEVEGWVLAESFGSQIAWPFCAHSLRFQPRGLILAGGFGRYPMPTLARLGLQVGPRLPLCWLLDLLRVYGWVARWRFRGAPARRDDIREFIARRTSADRDAAVHRLRLIVTNDPAPLAGGLVLPVHYLTGFLDPVVPWPWVPGWLRKHCRGFRGWRMIWGADHNVLGSGSKASADVILGWVRGSVLVT